MNKHLILLGLCFSLFFIQCESSKVGDDEKEKTEYKLVWSDEFDEDGTPDATKWGYDLGDGCPYVCGWGNNELQYYTNNSKNARVKNGHLIIEALKEDKKGKKYTSARLVTKKKGDWKYGKIEVKAKLPSGLGTWPAIWMLPTKNKYGGWPKSGEIDIMEHVGYAPDSIYGTVHTEAYNHIKRTHKDGNKVIKSEGVFHIYSIDWQKDKIDFLVDNELYFSFANEKKTFEEWPFDKAFYLILNVAVGGNWGGKHGVDATIFPLKIEVDYVRVYQK